MHETGSLYLDDPPAHDQWGLRALRVMLEDVEFPATGEELRDRVGPWRVPMPGRVMLRLGDLLEPVQGKRFRSVGHAVRVLGRTWPDLDDPRGPWEVQRAEDGDEDEGDE